MVRQKMNKAALILIMAIFVVALGTLNAQVSDVEPVEYHEINGKTFLIMRDATHETRGYFLNLPIKIKNSFWDDEYSMAYLTLGSEIPTLSDMAEIRHRFSFIDLYLIPTQKVEISWDEQFLNEVPCYIENQNSPTLDNLRIVFILSPLQYKKIKHIFGEGKAMSLSGAIELIYAGVKTLERSYLKVNRHILYTNLLSLNEDHVRNQNGMWLEEETLSALQANASKWAKNDSDIQHKLAPFWLYQLLHFYFEVATEEPRMYRLKKFDVLPNKEEIFEVNSVMDTSRKTKLFFNLF